MGSLDGHVWIQPANSVPVANMCACNRVATRRTCCCAIAWYLWQGIHIHMRVYAGTWVYIYVCISQCCDETVFLPCHEGKYVCMHACKMLPSAILFLRHANLMYVCVCVVIRVSVHECVSRNSLRPLCFEGIRISCTCVYVCVCVHVYVDVHGFKCSLLSKRS